MGIAKHFPWRAQEVTRPQALHRRAWAPRTGRACFIGLVPRFFARARDRPLQPNACRASASPAERGLEGALSRRGIGAAAGAEGAAAARGGRALGAEHTAVAQLVEVGEADAGQRVEEVGLGGTDVGGILRPGAEGAAYGHADHRTAEPGTSRIRAAFGDVKVFVASPEAQSFECWWVRPGGVY